MLGVTPGFRHAGETLVIGVDEAGRGPLAGPVVAAAVVLGRAIPAGLDDSKRLSAKRRAVLDEAIRTSCGWAVAVVEPAEIDRVNIFIATMLAMTRAVAALAGATGRQRGFGDFWAYGLLASGSTDVVIEASLNRWDLSAVRSLVLAAGGAVTDLLGRPTSDGGSAVATNGVLHAETMSLVGRHRVDA
jgi:fructose-1,6-bisphosphatase/inositol monophosphatase family enzyme